MGQEVSLTALQLARVAAVVANGGLLVQPRLVTAIRRPDGRVERPAAPPSRCACSRRRRRGRSAVHPGRRRRARHRHEGGDPRLLGGRARPARRRRRALGGYQAGRYVPNFVGFAPAENPRVRRGRRRRGAAGASTTRATSRRRSSRASSPRRSGSCAWRRRSSGCPRPCSPRPTAASRYPGGRRAGLRAFAPRPRRAETLPAARSRRRRSAGSA